MLDDSRIIPLLSSAFALLLGLLWVSGIFGRVWNLKRTNEASQLNREGCPPTEATSAVIYDEEVWEVPMDIGVLVVSKLLVHPIKVGLCQWIIASWSSRVF